MEMFRAAAQGSCLIEFAAAHRIDLTPARCLSGKWIGYDRSCVHYRGDLISEFRCPLYEASRYLLERGLASEADTIAAFRSGVMAISGRLGALAMLTIREAERVGPMFARWVPFDEGHCA